MARSALIGRGCGWLVVIGSAPSPAPPKQRTAPLLPAHQRTQPAHRATDPLKTSDLRRFVGCSRPSPTHHRTTPVLARPTPSPTLNSGIIGGWVYQRTNRPLAHPPHFLSKIAPTTSLPAGVSVVSLSVPRVRFSATRSSRPMLMRHDPWLMRSCHVHVVMFHHFHHLSSPISPPLSPFFPPILCPLMIDECDESDEGSEGVSDTLKMGSNHPLSQTPHCPAFHHIGFI